MTLETQNDAGQTLSDRRVSLVVDVRVKVRVEVQYEDRDSAFYDREDDRWVGAEDAAIMLEAAHQSARRLQLLALSWKAKWAAEP